MTTEVLAPTPLMKRCAICGEDKPATADYFYRRARSADGWQRHCRDCSRASIDKSEARRRQPQPIAPDWDALYTLVAARSEDVVDALLDAAAGGHLNPFDTLADALEPDCPTQQDNYTGADCVLHDLGRLYKLRLAEQHPSVAAAVEARVQALYPRSSVTDPLADAPEESESDAMPSTLAPA